MSISFESYRLGSDDRVIDVTEVVAVLESMPIESAVTFTWNDGEEDALIVGFTKGYSVATMLREGTFHDLQASEQDALFKRFKWVA